MCYAPELSFRVGDEATDLVTSLGQDRNLRKLRNFVAELDSPRTLATVFYGAGQQRFAIEVIIPP